MLTEEHFAMLTSFRIRAMADKLREMIDDPSYDSLTFEERMEMLIDAEASARRDRKIVFCQLGVCRLTVGKLTGLPVVMLPVCRGWACPVGGFWVIA